MFEFYVVLGLAATIVAALAYILFGTGGSG